MKKRKYRFTWKKGDIRVEKPKPAQKANVMTATQVEELELALRTCKRW